MTHGPKPYPGSMPAEGCFGVVVGILALGWPVAIAHAVIGWVS